MSAEWLSTFVIVYLAGYTVLACLLSGYGMHAYLMAGLFVRLARRRRRPPPLPERLPSITVQLPIYNEFYVVDRLIDAACRLDYPARLLEIQVLDDSDDETSERAAALCAVWRARGVRIEHRRRVDRRGYKGGALRAGLEATDSELIAVFDADFVPHPDFLMKVVPHFGDPAIGMVQARWGHLNEDYSTLTQVQAMALDGHFLIEQTVRNLAGVFINFNGTAGVWRRQAILDAGNWQDDTLTEDLDLSYRAQLAGWRFLFLPDLVCPAELPAEINAFKGQQFRWAKGSMQTARKLLHRIWHAPQPLHLKLQATLHLTNHAVYPLLLALALCSLPSLVILDRVPESLTLFRILTVLVIASFGHPVMYAMSQRARGRRWPGILRTVPLIIAGGMGIAVNNTRAVIEALRGHVSPFLRTPKYRIESTRDPWWRRRYRPRASQLAILEMLLGIYVLVAIVYAAASGSYMIIPFLALYVAGFLYVGLMSILQGRRRGALVAAASPGDRLAPPAGGTATDESTSALDLTVAGRAGG
ncbi:MAG: glycosyltransferase family 2 protein [Candidatus Eiseniibacteriota bacterium]